MYQKDLVRTAWKSAGLYDENDAKLQQFLAMLDDPTKCWTEMTDAARSSFATYKSRLAQPIMDTGDKLVRLMLIRGAVDTHADEIALLEKYIVSSDPATDAIELKAIALKNVPKLNRALARKKNLPQDILSTVMANAPGGARRKAAPAPTAAPVKTTQDGD